MTRLSVTLTCQNTVDAEALYKQLQPSYADAICHLTITDSEVYLLTVLSDEDWAKTARKYTRIHASAEIGMRAYASFGDGFYKVYKSTFKNGSEHEEKPEVHSVYEDDLEVVNA